MVVFEAPNVQLIYKDQADILLIKWLEKPDYASFVSVYLQAFRYVTEEQMVYSYCTDLSAIGALDRDQEAWLNFKYYPMVYNLIQDDIYIAVVFSEEHFKAIVTNYQASTPAAQHHFVHLNYFTNQQEAYSWLNDTKKGLDTALTAAPWPL